MKEQKIVNGVNVDQLFGTIEAIKENSEIAKFKFRAHNKWIDGGNNRSTIKDFYGACQEDPSRSEPFVMDNDEPAVLLGTDKGANPAEYVLHALAGCITTTLVYHAASKGIKIEEMETKYEGDLDLRGILGLPGCIRNGYEGIRDLLKSKQMLQKSKSRSLLSWQKDTHPFST